MIMRRGVSDGIFRYAYHRPRIELIEFFCYTAIYMLTAAQWATIMSAPGSTFGFYIEAYQTDTPVTGWYQSEYITVSKPA